MCLDLTVNRQLNRGSVPVEMTYTFRATNNQTIVNFLSILYITAGDNLHVWSQLAGCYNRR